MAGPLLDPLLLIVTNNGGTSNSTADEIKIIKASHYIEDK